MLTDKELEQALETHRAAVYRLAYSFTGNAADSEDIAQEAFLRLFMRHRALDDEEQTRAWLLKVTANLCKNHLRSHWNKKRSDPPEDIPGTDNMTEYTELRCALESLDPKQRAAVYLFYGEGLSVKETANILGISVTAVTTRLQRGREALRDLLSDT